MSNLLIVVRDIHFASSVIVAGIVFFDWLIVAPVLGADLRLTATFSSFRETTQKILWLSLGVSIVSALAWLCLLSTRIAGKPFEQVIADGTIWIVLSRTQFGNAWAARILVAGLLAICLASRQKLKALPTDWRGVLSALLAGFYLGLMAFAGHGEEGLGFERDIHLAADFLHLVAAGLWLGGLLPLAILLTYLRMRGEEPWLTAACNAGSRFSTLGILAVSILLISGTINASFLVGGIQSLIDTRYGRLLLLKLALFAVMVSAATINRQYLLPRLCKGDATDRSDPTVRWLVRSTLAELALGLGIILIVGVLGITAPAVEMASHVH
ncbi:MAG: copper homeostasis membrane protein CopD [Bradyrhizobium sp.]